MMTESDLEMVVRSASRLASNWAGTRQVPVVANRRLTYDELARCRQDADQLRLQFRMDGAGTIRLRRQSGAVVGPSPHHRLRWWQTVWNFVHRHHEQTADWRMP